MNKNLLEVKNLKKYFVTPKGMLHAVDNISFSLEKGRCLGVVGESGCGKSTMGRVLIRLIEATSGEIKYKGKDIGKFNRKELLKLREEVQMIFQDPYASLNPRMNIEEIISEPLIIHKKLKKREEISKKVREVMELVGLNERVGKLYPHELDGGRRQRVGIARAIVLNPEFIICDEPVSALDVSIQAQILNLMKDLQEKLGLTYIFITHDLSVVRFFSDEIIVMYLGEIVEKAESKELFKNPKHPYTKALLASIPSLTNRKRERIKGEITSPIEPDKGCRFRKRCKFAKDICETKETILREVSKGHYIACHFDFE